MRDWLDAATEHAVVLIDALALAIVVYGTAETFVGVLRWVRPSATARELRATGLRYGRWLVTGLSFQLAADVVETSITTRWEALGRLAAIALIRTFRNFFLERDLADVRAAAP